MIRVVQMSNGAEPVALGEPYSTMGQRIHHLRDQRGLSMRELARRAGCSTQYISYLESGQCTMPSMVKLSGIATGLRMPFVDFLRDLGMDAPQDDPDSGYSGQLRSVLDALSYHGRAEVLRYAQYRLAQEQSQCMETSLQAVSSN